MKTVPTLKQLQEAAAVFEDDVYIPKTGHVKVTSPIGISYVPPHGTYWVTDWRRTNEKHFKAAVKGKKVIFFVGCMDKHFATRAWQWAQQPNHLVIPAFIAGGIAQVDAHDRLLALKTVVDYVSANTKKLKIIVTAHVDNCAGLQITNNLSCSVSTFLGCQSGDMVEEDFVVDRMKRSAQVVLAGRKHELWLLGGRELYLTAKKIK